MLKVRAICDPDPRRANTLDNTEACGYLVTSVTFSVQVLAMTRIARLHNQWREEMRSGAILEERVVRWGRLRTLF